MKTFFYILVAFFLVLFSCYQDSHLSQVIGELGRTPLPLLLPFFVYCEIKIFKNPITNYAYVRINRIYYLFILCFFIISFFNLVIWFAWFERPMVYLKQNVILKTLKFSVYYFLFWGLFRTFYFLLCQKQMLNYVSLILGTIIGIHICVIIVELIQMPEALLFLHANNMLYYRVRMLTYESSWTGSIAIFLFTSLMAFTNLKAYRILGLVFIIFFFVTTDSKQFMGIFPISIILALILTKRSIPWYFGLILFSVTIYGMYEIVPILNEKIEVDLKEFSSTVTRTSTYLTSFRIFFSYPLGTGGLYYYYIVQNISDTALLITDWLGVGNTIEIDNLGGDTDEFITCGSTLTEWIVLIGVFGLWLYFKLVKSLFLFSRNSFWLTVGCIHFIITNSLLEVATNRLTWPLFFAVVAYYYDRKNDMIP